MFQGFYNDFLQTKFMKSCGLASYLNYMHNKNVSTLLEALFFSFTVQRCSTVLLTPCLLAVALIAPCNEAI